MKKTCDNCIHDFYGKKARNEPPHCSCLNCGNYCNWSSKEDKCDSCINDKASCSVRPPDAKSVVNCVFYKEKSNIIKTIEALGMTDKLLDQKDLILAELAKVWVSKMKEIYNTNEKVSAIFAIITSLFTEAELKTHLQFVQKGKNEPQVKSVPEYDQIMVAMIRVTGYLLEITKNRGFI